MALALKSVNMSGFLKCTGSFYNPGSENFIVRYLTSTSLHVSPFCLKNLPSDQRWTLDYSINKLALDGIGFSFSIDYWP